MRHYAPAPIEKVLPFITQLAGAIDFARSAGVGHGALHPRDIFVTPEEARASGFGVVEALERVGLRAPVRRPYTAPERVAGEAWDARADVFSLGVIAYELLTGRRPSGTGTRIGTITGGRHAAAIHGVLAQAMDDDPARRQTSALAFASALDAASRGEQASVPASAASAPAAAVRAALTTNPTRTRTRTRRSTTIAAERDDGRGASGAAARRDRRRSWLAPTHDSTMPGSTKRRTRRSRTWRWARRSPAGTRTSSVSAVPAERPIEPEDSDDADRPAARPSRAGRATDSYAAACGRRRVRRGRAGRGRL